VGDIADYCYDRAMDELADLDHDDEGYHDHRYTPRPPPRCHSCGAICYWIMTNGKWVLHERGQRHICPPKDNTPEGFE